MRTFRHVAALTLLAASLGGCAVQTSAPTEGVASPESTGTSAEAMLVCRSPIVTLPMADTLACSTYYGRAQGSAIGLTTSGYTKVNCSGRAVLEASLPDCTPVTPYTWQVMAIPYETQSYSPDACAASYADYTQWTQSRTTGLWSEGATGRVYGKIEWGQCFIEVSGEFTGDEETFEVTADAYTPFYFNGLILGYTPVDVQLRVDAY
jgi:hypothetical protein